MAYNRKQQELSPSASPIKKKSKPPTARTENENVLPPMCFSLNENESIIFKVCPVVPVMTFA